LIFVSNGTVSQTPFASSIYNAVASSSSYPSVVHSGSYGVFLGDTELATLSQTLATNPVEKYLLLFWLDNTTSGSGRLFQAIWNGSFLFNVSSPAAFAWTNLQIVVATISSSSELKFGSENNAAYFGLDDITETHIPAVAFKAAIVTAGTFNLTWATATGLVYQVQYKTNRLKNNWLNLSNLTTVTTTNLSESDFVSSPQRFYRLSVTP